MTGKKLIPLILLVAIFALILPRAGVAANAAKDLKELCQGDNKDKPFKNLRPFQPSNAAEKNYQVGAEIDDNMERSLQFGHCNDVRKDLGTPEKEQQLCDLTFAKILRSFLEAEASYKKTLGDVCKKLDACMANPTTQAGSEGCSRDVYKSVGNDLKKITDDLRKKANTLVAFQGTHVNLLKKDQKKASAPPADSSTSDTDYPKRNMAMKKFAQEAATGKPVNRESQITECQSSVQQNVFCDNVAAATDAKIFADAFNLQIKTIEPRAKEFAKMAALAQSRDDKSGSPGGGGGGGGDSKKDASSGMDLNDMMKMATVGMMGAGLYCSMTGKCSKKDPQSGITDPNANGAATSPTPTMNPGGNGTSSGNSSTGPSSSPTGNSSTGTSSTASIGNTGSSNTGTVSNTATTAGGGSSPSSGGVSGIGSPPLSTTASLDKRTPASSGAVGGGAGGGMDSSGSSKPAADSGAAASPLDSQKSSNDFGFPSSGGGSSGMPSGGFSLGDSKTTSPTDAALKDILNGETPPGGDPLAGLGEAAAGATGAQASEAGANDPDNLFKRIRESYIRCVRRGCVSHEVGDKI